MIARRALPDRYVEWNQRWGAPHGLPEGTATSRPERLARPTAAMGPFAFQVAGDTKVFEYPWAYFAAEAGAGDRVLEVGGGAGGLQFVLAREGCRVVNVDSGQERPASSVEQRFATHLPELHPRLNAMFGTDVRLVRDPLLVADLPAASFDRAVCLSLFEGLGPDAGRRLVERVAALLAPGSLLLVTAALFFELEPFGRLERNDHGSNIDLYRLVGGLGLELVRGDPRELNGFPEFDPHHVVARVGDLLMSRFYPYVIQTMVLRRTRT